MRTGSPRGVEFEVTQVDANTIYIMISHMHMPAVRVVKRLVLICDMSISVLSAVRCGVVCVVRYVLLLRYPPPRIVRTTAEMW